MLRRLCLSVARSIRGGLQQQRTIALLTLVLATSMVQPSPALAQLTWNGSVSNQWSVPVNWTPNLAPTNGSDLVLDNGGLSRPTNYNLANVSLHSITITGVTNLAGLQVSLTPPGTTPGLQSGGSITNNNTPSNIVFHTGFILNGPATFTNSAGAMNLVFDTNPITGTGPLTLVNNSANDTLQLNTANTYAGPTIVNGSGRVSFGVNGAVPMTSALTVNGSAIFQTSSTIGGLAGGGQVTVLGTLTVNGTVAPGPAGGIGTMNVNGAINLGGGTFQVNTAGSTGSHLQVTGPATINGGTVVVSGTGLGTFNVLTASGGRTGTFASVADNIPFTTAQLIYDPNNVFVVVAVGSGSGLTFNQASALTAFLSNPAAGAAITTFSGLSTAQARYTLDQLSGEVYASALSAGIENQALWLRTIAQHVRLANQCLCPATGAGGQSGCNADGTWRTWATPFGQAGTNQGDGNAHAFAYNSVGFAAGGDRSVGEEGNGLLGFATGYSNWGNVTNFINSSTSSNSFNMAGYARAQLGQAWLFGITSYEYDGFSSVRPMTFLGSTAFGNFSGNQLGQYIESGYAVNLGGLQVQPLGAVQYISAWRNSVHENGAGALDLNVNGARADSFRTQMGSRMLYPITTSRGRCILPEAGAYWIHEYAQNSREDVNQFAGGGPVFLSNGGNLGRDFGLFTTGFSTQMGPSLRAGMYYMNYVTPTAVAHGGMGQVQLAW